MGEEVFSVNGLRQDIASFDAMVEDRLTELALKYGAKVINLRVSTITDEKSRVIAVKSELGVGI